MNKLELVQRFSRESKINATGPKSTLNQTGMFLKCVDWIDEAYNDIQISHPDWRFLRKEFSFTMTAGNNSYTSALCGVTDLAEWITSEFIKVGFDGCEHYVFYIDWDKFRESYLIGSQQSTGTPCAFTIKPDNSLMFWPSPSQNFICSGEYYATPDVMGGDDPDSAEPVFPVRYHMAIMWRALIIYAPHSAQPDRWVQGVNEYNYLMRKMELSELPKIRFGGSLV